MDGKRRPGALNGKQDVRNELSTGNFFGFEL